MREAKKNLKVFSFGLHLLNVGVALAFMAAGGMVIRHVCRHDEFFEELDSLPRSDSPSHLVDQIVVVLTAEPFKFFIFRELNGDAAS